MTDSELRNVTIVVPTKNRLYYVTRLLRYYVDMNFTGNLLIIDSSDDDIAKNIRKYINNIDKENFQYIFSLGLPTMVIKENLSYIKTKYVSFLGDDDYIIPNGILSSIDYLKVNLDVVACRGEGLTITDPSISSEYISRFSCVDRLENNSRDRVIEHFKNYSTPFFHVCRSEVFIKAFSNAPSISEMDEGYDRLIGDELLVSALMLVYGKFASIEGLHLIRTNNVERVELRNSWYDDSQGKEMAIQDFTKKITEAIVNEEKISFEAAEKVVLRIQEYPIFTTKYNSPFKENLNSFFRPILQFLSLLEAYRNLKNSFNIIKRKFLSEIFETKSKRLGLNNMLNIDNFYHKEFMPIYKSLTNHDLKK
tara:strand:+ start:646 stop:1740 length:1095 start_codon:yes stop_codon:yes gene_type:complete